MSLRIVSLITALIVAPAATHATDEALFQYDGKRFTAEDLSTRMQQLYGSVMADHHRAMRALVDEMVFDVYVEREAKRTGREIRAVGRELLTVEEPTIQEIRAFYDNNQASFNQPFELLGEQIKRHLQREAVIKKRSDILARIKSEGGFELLLETPQAPPIVINTRGRPVRGNPSAPITLVEFADYQCPRCKNAVTIFNHLLELYPDDIKLVHMDFPINSSGISRVVAYGAACAQTQGKFWEYHDLAFNMQDTLDRNSPARLAQSVGLDMERFGACMKDPSTRQKVQASESEAKRLGLRRTPSLFVDGRPFPSNHLLKDLGAYIAEKTSKKSS